MANQLLGPPPGMTVLPTPKLPITQLESLKYKATQIIESIHYLQWTLDASGRPDLMPAWPDILSKYNMLLSQTHNFSNALVHPFPTSNATGSSKTAPPNIYERIALHPNRTMADMQLDTDISPLLRNQQTTDVLSKENDTVRRLSEHMSTRGSVGVLGISPPPATGFGVAKKPEYEDVLQECAGIRGAHDRRVERAVRAVDMLKEKFDWKQRVMVEVEEPEELDWDPRMGRTTDVVMSSASEDSDSESDAPNEEVAPVVVNSDEDDEYNVEGALFNTSPTAEFGTLSSFGMDAT